MQVAKRKGERLNETVNSICHLMLGSKNPQRESPLPHRQLQINEMSFEQLKKLAVEKAENLLENFDSQLQRVWVLRANLTGSLSDCIEKAITIKQNDFLESTNLNERGRVNSSEQLSRFKTDLLLYKKNMKIAILTIERLSEDQLLGDEKPKLSFDCKLQKGYTIARISGFLYCSINNLVFDTVRSIY